jgi:hypothetical protein
LARSAQHFVKFNENSNQQLVDAAVLYDMTAKHKSDAQASKLLWRFSDVFSIVGKNHVSQPTP